MLAKVKSYALYGLTGVPVDVEVDVSYGMPSFDIVGLPDASVKEAKERVRSAIKNNGKKFPNTRITINLAPADLKKQGSYFDLAIAIGMLQASESEKMQFYKDYVLIGELSLDGTLRAVSGLLPMLISAAVSVMLSLAGAFIGAKRSSSSRSHSKKSIMRSAIKRAGHSHR